MTPPLRRLVMVAVLPTVLLAAGCSAPATEPAPDSTDTSTSAPVVAADPQTVAPDVLSAVAGFSVPVISDQAAHIHAVWPEIPGQSALNGALREAVETSVESFRRDYVAGSENAIAKPELNISWEAVGSSPTAIGILTHQYLNAGASTANSWRTTWADPTSNTVHPNRDLVTDADAFNAAVRAALGGVSAIDTSELDSVLAAGPPVVAFTASGQLLVGFDDYQIAAGSEGSITAVLPRDVTDGLLSAFGEAARRSALEPQAPPAPSPSPSTPAPPPSTPAPSPSADAQQAPPAADRVNCAKAKCVAITYDDGPGTYSGRLLDVLHKKHARVTFFALGQQIRTFPKIAKRAVAEGNEYGIHTWDHKQLTTLSPAQVYSEMKRAVDAAEKATGVRPTLYRPPYGSTDAAIRRQAKKLGLAEILWTVDTLDWKDRNTDVVVRRVLQQTRRNSIVLVHEIHQTTVAGTARIVDGLRKRGFTLVTVSELLGNPKPGVKYP